MRVVIARFPFDLTKSGVLESMKGVKPEPVDGESVIIGRRHYPVKQVGQVVTRQDRRDFTAAEVVRAMTLLGFTCRGLPQVPATYAGAATPAGAATSGLTAFQRASAMLGEPAKVSVSA
ncbi:MULTISPECIES: SCO5918 family protein [unclassified Streptomyces]|uniref:SCO5918 family protein n=1 Tax=unclassified Streptomyces TaxID=2593676 RepID=UPI002E2E6C48|nr:SCO5918 family protein [Streptomyces sp. NBC_00273]